MKSLVYIFHIGFIGLFTSCDSKSTVAIDESALYKIDLTSSPSNDSLISPRQLLTDVTYIPLNSSDTFFLTTAKKILELNKKIFVLDGNKQELVAYDLQGNFLGRVGQKGEGPEEYKSVTDFVVDTKRELIVIFSRADQAIIIFNSTDLSFKRKVRLGIWAFQISILESGNLALYTYFGENGGGENIQIFTIEGKPIGSKMPYPRNDQYTPMDYSGFISGNYYTYPLSSKIYKLDENRPTDKVIAEFSFPGKWDEKNRYNHSDFLNSNRTQNQTLSKFAVGNDASELLFFYGLLENDYRIYTLGAMLSSGQIFGHLNLKHGFKSNSDLFGKLFFKGPYNLPTFSNGYYYVSTDIESMSDLFYADKKNALKEITQIDKELAEILNQERDHETSIIMRFKLRSSYE